MKKLVGICLLVLCLGFDHPWHATTLDLEYNRDTETLQGVLYVFTDDLEAALRKANQNIQLHLGEEDENTELVDSLIIDYLKDHLKIQLNNNRIPVQYIGHVGDYAEMELYLEYPTGNISGALQMQNTMFFELFQDQRHLINLDVNNTIKSHTLTLGNSKTQWDFK